LSGRLLLGWGLFNLVEGVVDHHITVHHVRDDASDPLDWDLAFPGVVQPCASPAPSSIARVFERRYPGRRTQREHLR
jgi:Predicted membrane protein (DUF2243)